MLTEVKRAMCRQSENCNKGIENTKKYQKVIELNNITKQKNSTEWLN